MVKAGEAAAASAGHAGGAVGSRGASAGDAETVVFYFGPGQGGGVESNIARWAGQFTLEPQSEKRNPKGRIWTHPVVIGGKLFVRLNVEVSP